MSGPAASARVAPGAGAPAPAGTVLPDEWRLAKGKENCPVAGCARSCNTVSALRFHLKSHTPQEAAAVRLPPPLGAPPAGPFH
jgi:hypothetical protein